MRQIQEFSALEEKSEAILLRKIMKDFKIVKRERFMKGEGFVLVKKGEFFNDLNMKRRGKRRIKKKM